MDTRRNVDERSTRPRSRVECRELVVTGRNTLTEIFFEDFGMFTQTSVCVRENHTLTFKIFLNLLVDDLGLILSRNARNKAVLFGFWDAQTIVGIANFFRKVFPVINLTISRTHVVLECLEINVRQIRTPRGHRLAFEEFQRLEAAFTHPLRFILYIGDITNDRLVNPKRDVFRIVIVIVPPILIGADGTDDLIVTQSSCVGDRW